MRRWPAVLTVVLTAAVAVAPAGATGATSADWSPRPATYGVARTTNVPIRMDDGVVLKADVLRPARADGTAAKGPFPVILTQTPYNKNVPAENFENDYLVERGYIQAIVDVRGTGSSGGRWTSFGAREQRDYYATAVWAHQLPGGDGRVGLYGVSYAAIAALFTAAQQPPGLKASFPVVPAGDVYRDVAFTGGQADTGFIPSWLGNVTADAVVPPTDIADDPAGSAATLGEHVRAVAGFQAPLLTSALTGQPAGGYDAAYDGSFYRTRSPLRVVDRIRTPTFVVGGEYDLFQRGEPMLYNRLRANGVPARLLVGPWTHIAASLAATDTSGTPSLPALQLRWFDHYVRGVPDAALDSDVPPVTAYRLGAGRYQHMNAYPPADTRYRRLPLSGSASPGSPGRLVTSRPAAGTGTVPWVPVAGACSESTSQWTAGEVPVIPGCTDDHRANDALGAAYDLPVTGRKLRFAGTSMARLYVSTTGRDAMLTTRLEDVAPDGSSTPLTSGWQVLSLRVVDKAKSAYADGRLVQPWHPDTRESVRAVQPGVVYRLDVEIFPTLASVAPGHSLRLAVQAADEPHSTAPLPQLRDEAGGTVTLHAGPSYPSALVLGVEG
ncbi:MAG: CocE/NonD family hydrolase [Streptosporangiales bacterium]|nr:CocE/NonD family hydrolase [Streptosporangiales bacterium]